MQPAVFDFILSPAANPHGTQDTSVLRFDHAGQKSPALMPPSGQQASWLVDVLPLEENRTLFSPIAQPSLPVPFLCFGIPRLPCRVARSYWPAQAARKTLERDLYFARAPPRRGHHATRTVINARVTIRTEEPEVPSEFPPTRLFLDDIEEIVRILREFLETRKMDSRSTVEDLKLKVRFSTGGKQCDDILDLPKIAKSNRELSISITKGDWPQTSLRFHPWFGTFWRSSGLTKEDTWSAFHKLQTVFQKRTRGWSALFRSLPSWLVWFLWTVAVSLLPLLRFPLYKLMPHRAAYAIVLLSYGTIITAAVIGARHTTLVLRHSWDPPPIRQYVKDKLIPVIIGALLGIGGTILAMYLRHKFWP
jgi:hypothetical protein